MEILLAFLFGAAAGGVVQVALPHRGTRGVALAPVLGALVAGLAWMLLTWLGWTPDNPLLWVLPIVAAAAVTVVSIAVLGRVRTEHDRRERARLKIG